MLSGRQIFPIISAKTRAETTALVQMHALKEEPYVPADDGFVFQTYIRENNLSCQEDLFHIPTSHRTTPKKWSAEGADRSVHGDAPRTVEMVWVGDRVVSPLCAPFFSAASTVPLCAPFFSAASSVNSYVIPKCDSESER